MDAILRPSNEPLENCSSTKDVHDALLTYSDASALWRGELLRLSLAISFAHLEAMFGMGTIIYILQIVQPLDFDMPLFNIQVKSIMCSRKISNCIVKQDKP